MGKNGQLDKPTRARLLSYFSVHEHAAEKLTPTCQVCIGTILRKVSIGCVLGHFVAGVSGASTCDYVNNVSPNDLNLFHKAAGLSESETTEPSTKENTRKQMNVDEGLTRMSNYMIKDKPHFCLKPEKLMLQVFVHVNNKVEWKRKEGLWNSQTATWCKEEDD